MEPTFQLIFNIAVALAGALGLFFLKRVFKMFDDHNTRQNELSKEVKDLAIKLPSDYVHKNDFNHAVDAIFQKLDRIESKIDKKADKE
jgi:hypothetical protein